MRYTVLFLALFTSSAMAIDFSSGDSNAQATAGAIAASGAIAGSSSGGNSYSNEYNEARVDQTYRKYTPSPAAPSMGSTTPCLIGISGSLGVPGLAIAGGGGIIDPTCVRGEAIRRGLSGDALSQALANEIIQADLQKIIDEEDMPLVVPRGIKDTSTHAYDSDFIGG